jgi:hypothetical protein
MAWQYVQRSGRLSSADSKVIAKGYSGFGAGKNAPELQKSQGIGPIPVGRYSIGRARDTDTHGPCVLPLTPDTSNEMFGRGGFLIHGDSIAAPGTASNGCIILDRHVRDAIDASSDRKLEVRAETAQ